MEATGPYWKPIWYVLEDRGFELKLVNAKHVKMVPGRKTDMADAAWLAELLEHGLLRRQLGATRGAGLPPRAHAPRRVAAAPGAVLARALCREAWSKARPGLFSCWRSARQRPSPPGSELAGGWRVGVGSVQPSEERIAVKRSVACVSAALALALGVSAPASAATANSHASCSGLAGASRAGQPGAEAEVQFGIQAEAAAQGIPPGAIEGGFSRLHEGTAEVCLD
jgi:Transposase